MDWADERSWAQVREAMGVLWWLKWLELASTLEAVSALSRLAFELSSEWCPRCQSDSKRPEWTNAWSTGSRVGQPNQVRVPDTRSSLRIVRPGRSEWCTDFRPPCHRYLQFELQNIKQKRKNNMNRGSWGELLAARTWRNCRRRGESGLFLRMHSLMFLPFLLGQRGHVDFLAQRLLIDFRFLLRFFGVAVVTVGTAAGADPFNQWFNSFGHILAEYVFRERQYGIGDTLLRRRRQHHFRIEQFADDRRMRWQFRRGNCWR